MKVNVVLSLRNVDKFEIDTTGIKNILSYIKNIKGETYINNLMEGNFKYILTDSTEKLKPIALMPEVIFSDFTGYDNIYIIHEICGEGTAILIAIGAASSATAIGASIPLSIAALTINLAISIAISFVISLLSPTPEFSSDPGLVDRKQSNLFEGAPLIREQGGSVPIIFGKPFFGGVLISSGISTEDII